MHRLLMFGATAVAGALIATPTVVGLSGNTSFSRDLQVPVPSGAHHLQLSDLTSSAHSSSSPTDDRTSPSGDDRSVVEDRPGSDLASSDATDDHGGLRTGDDNSGPGGGSSGSDDHRSGDDGDSGRSRGGDG